MSSRFLNIGKLNAFCFWRIQKCRFGYEISAARIFGKVQAALRGVNIQLKEPKSLNCISCHTAAFKVTEMMWRNSATRCKRFLKHSSLVPLSSRMSAELVYFDNQEYSQN